MKGAMEVAEGGPGGPGDKQTYQMAVAISMGNFTNTTINKPEFIVALGDNFYTKGVSSTSDNLWKYLWTDIYLKYQYLQVPWFPVFGNHDYGYGESGLIARQNSGDCIYETKHMKTYT